MKTRLLFLLSAALSAFSLSGCVSAGTPAATTVSSTVTAIDDLAEPVAQAAVLAVMNNNPKYVSDIEAVGLALPAALGSGVLSSTTITAAAASIGEQKGLPTSITGSIAGVLTALVNTYESKYGTAVGASTSANGKAILLTLSQAVTGAYTIWLSGQPTVTLPPTSWRDSAPSPFVSNVHRGALLRTAAIDLVIPELWIPSVLI